jgi:hypothetical protein
MSLMGESSSPLTVSGRSVADATGLRVFSPAALNADQVNRLRREVMCGSSAHKATTATETIGDKIRRSKVIVGVSEGDIYQPPIRHFKIGTVITQIMAEVPIGNYQIHHRFTKRGRGQ